ncbi:MAG: porin PorA family protein [Phototrophicaceae bacterium]|jgi:hypothetical protein
MKRLQLTLGIVVIVIAVAWPFTVSPRFAGRFPEGWSWEVNTLGHLGTADPATGEFAPGTTLADEPIHLNVRLVSADTTDTAPGQIKLTDLNELRNSVTNVVEWESNTDYFVDATTGRVTDGEFTGTLFLFPRNVQKDEIYSLTSYSGVQMRFQREEEIAGIDTYVFGNYEPWGSTQANAAFVPLEVGQSTQCVEFSLEYWVEPVTGEVVKFREWCERDVLVGADGEVITTLFRWGSESTGDDLIRQSALVNARLNTFRWMTLYIPALLGVVGVILAGLGLFRPSPKSGDATLAST